jgi:magnesium-protoporphyrin O-methyltransferase
MPQANYQTRREQLRTYFDDTAVEAWKRLTSEAPVSGIRATVRQGRERMRTTLLDWLGPDLAGARILDAGCGTGAFAREAARRGAAVVAVDLSPKLVAAARDVLPLTAGHGSVTWHVGDMRDRRLGRFDYVVAMDSLIHYHAADITAVLADFAERTDYSILYTFAPRTALLTAMHTAGRLFPRGDRAPAIEPVSEKAMRAALARNPALRGWRPARTTRVNAGFYISQAMELSSLEVSSRD